MDRGGGGPSSAKSNHVTQRDIVNDGEKTQPSDGKQRRDRDTGATSVASVFRRHPRS